MKRIHALITLLLVAAAMAGCAAADGGGRARPEPTPEAQLAVPSVEGLPDYAYRSAAALKGYQIAVLEKELLARLPCYCGCGQDEQFQNLRDCFLNSEDEFSPHGANCEVCQEEARDAMIWKGQGMSVKEIRQRIDSDYEGRGKPTDTSPVVD